MDDRHLVTVQEIDRGERAEELRAELARALGGGTVGAPDGAGMVEIELTADSREDALQRVVDALAAVGGDDHFIFPDQTGTEYRPPQERGRVAPGADRSESGEPADETRRPTWLEGVEGPVHRERLGDDEVPDPPNELPGPDDEPPHLERASPQEDDSAPGDPPPRDIP
jgi:hypothetical protein